MSDGDACLASVRWRLHLTRECFPPPSSHELLRYLAISERYSSRFRFLACSSVSGPVETAAGFACDYIADSVKSGPMAMHIPIQYSGA